MSDLSEKEYADLVAWEKYKTTHSSDGTGLGTPKYPDNRKGRRDMARTWKNVPPLVYHR